MRPPPAPLREAGGERLGVTAGQDLAMLLVRWGADALRRDGLAWPIDPLETGRDATLRLGGAIPAGTPTV